MGSRLTAHLPLSCRYCPPVRLIHACIYRARSTYMRLIIITVFHTAQFTELSSVSLDSPGEVVSLATCSSGWRRINSSGLPAVVTDTNFTVNSPEDQAKYICTSSATWHEIVYVVITGIASYPGCGYAVLTLSLCCSQIITHSRSSIPPQTQLSCSSVQPPPRSQPVPHCRPCQEQLPLVSMYSSMTLSHSWKPASQMVW